MEASEGWYDAPAKKKKRAAPKPPKVESPAKKRPPEGDLPEDVLSQIDMLLSNVVTMFHPHADDTYDDALLDEISISMLTDGPAAEVKAALGVANYNTVAKLLKSRGIGGSKAKIGAIKVKKVLEDKVMAMPALVSLELTNLADAVASEEFSATLLKPIIMGMASHAGATRHLKYVLGGNFDNVIANAEFVDSKKLTLYKWREMAEELYFLADSIRRM
jgi:hypothetical protein